jgi:hypothetical protein
MSLHFSFELILPIFMKIGIKVMLLEITIKSQFFNYVQSVRAIRRWGAKLWGGIVTSTIKFWVLEWYMLKNLWSIRNFHWGNLFLSSKIAECGCVKVTYYFLFDSDNLWTVGDGHTILYKEIRDKFTYTLWVKYWMQASKYEDGDDANLWGYFWQI